MALAERFLAERFNRPGHELVDHRTYAICSDGDLMEGISQEAASIAGHFGLGKLTLCYDDNHITIDGTTALVLRLREPHRALRRRGLARAARRGLRGRRGADARAARSPANTRSARRSSRSARTSPTPRRNAVDTAKSHGAALGEDEVRATKEVMGFDPDKKFWVDERVYEHMSLSDKGAARAERVEERAAGPVARGLPGDGRRLGPRVAGQAARRLAERRCRSSRPARRSPRARPGRRRWPRSPSSARR